MQSLQRTSFLTEEARQSRRCHRNNRRVPPIARCTVHKSCIKNTRKRHGSLTTIIGRGQRCEALNASRALPWRKGHAAVTHLGLCNRLWASYIFATSRQLAFLHPPTLKSPLESHPLHNPARRRAVIKSPHHSYMGCTVSAPHHFLHAPGHRSKDSRSEGLLTSKTHPYCWTGKNKPTDADVRPLYNIPHDCH